MCGCPQLTCVGCTTCVGTGLENGADFVLDGGLSSGYSGSSGYQIKNSLGARKKKAKAKSSGIGSRNRMSFNPQRSNRTTLDGTKVQYGFDGHGGRHVVKTTQSTDKA